MPSTPAISVPGKQKERHERKGFHDLVRPLGHLGHQHVERADDGLTAVARRLGDLGEPVEQGLEPLRRLLGRDAAELGARQRQQDPAVCDERPAQVPDLRADRDETVEASARATRSPASPRCRGSRASTSIASNARRYPSSTHVRMSARNPRPSRRPTSPAPSALSRSSSTTSTGPSRTVTTHDFDTRQSTRSSTWLSTSGHAPRHVEVAAEVAEVRRASPPRRVSGRCRRRSSSAFASRSTSSSPGRSRSIQRRLDGPSRSSNPGQPSISSTFCSLNRSASDIAPTGPSGDDVCDDDEDEHNDHERADHDRHPADHRNRRLLDAPAGKLLFTVRGSSAGGRSPRRCRDRRRAASRGLAYPFRAARKPS